MSGTEQATAPRRLVVCCDGTWNDSESRDAATNVLRLARIVKPTAADGTPQIVYYDPGVGSGNFFDRMTGGMSGAGLLKNIREAYAFIVNNFPRTEEHEANDDDRAEILLFGFSRGAYTARCIAGLIGRIGILRKRQMGAFDEAWNWSKLSSAGLSQDALKKREEDLARPIHAGFIRDAA